MSKRDPAFLFYPGEWLQGTQLFSRSHKGAYMDILMAQFNNGHMGLADIQHILGQDYETMWESKLKAKFQIDDKGLYYNDKLQRVLDERDAYKEGRLENLKGHKKPHKETPHGNPTCRDRDRSKGKVKKEIVFSEDYLKFWGLYCGPNKTENAKPSCYKLWEALTDQERELALSVLPAYIANASEPKFIAKPSRYLSEKMWTADYRPKPEKKSALDLENKDYSEGMPK